MRRAVARGRMFPQGYSTDRRYGRLSLKAIGLFPLMWANADDQGRLGGDPEEIKYAVCPNIDHITKQDIPDLLQELQENKLILCYDSQESPAIQMLDWWDANQKMQWAWPSDYPPPEGWQDHLRYKKDAKTVFSSNWPLSGERSPENSGDNSGENADELAENPPLKTPPKRIKETITINKTIRGRGNSPEFSGENTPPPTHSFSSFNKIFP